MSLAADHPSGLRCTHCGREVAETVHTRAAYRVDYYSLYTGEVEPITLQRDDEVVTVLKLLTRRDVVTCVDCYRRPDMRVTREILFRPEQQAAAS